MRFAKAAALFISLCVLVLWFLIGAFSGLESTPELETHVALGQGSDAIGLAVLRAGCGPHGTEDLFTMIPRSILTAPERVFVDGWGRPLELEITRSGFVVWSRGPDGIRETEDDIREERKTQPFPRCVEAGGTETSTR